MEDFVLCKLKNESQSQTQKKNQIKYIERRFLSSLNLDLPLLNITI